jgi:hypothetical protein
MRSKIKRLLNVVSCLINLYGRSKHRTHTRAPLVDEDVEMEIYED